MQPSFYSSRAFRFFGLVLGLLIWLANTNNPPTAVTGAPFDNGTCNNCHGGGNYTGLVNIGGFPSVVRPNTVYPLEITLTPQSGNPNRGGFQLVVVDGNNQNAGDLAATNPQSGTEFFAGREYLEHRSPKLFSGGNPATWSFNWTSPATAARDTIRFYLIGNFCNGNGSSSGDIAFSSSIARPFAADTTISVGEPLLRQAMRLYPNPAINCVYVEGIGGVNSFEVYLSNAAGQLLRTEVLQKGEALPLYGLEPGIYFVSIRLSGDVQHTLRLVLQ